MSNTIYYKHNKNKIRLDLFCELFFFNFSFYIDKSILAGQMDCRMDGMIIGLSLSRTQGLK